MWLEKNELLGRVIPLLFTMKEKKKGVTLLIVLYIVLGICRGARSVN